MTKENGKPITIVDVAKESGFSVSTVSRVLNNKDDVAESTKKHIEDVVQRLGFTSSLAAKSMRSRKNNLIGLIVPDVSESFCFQLMKGVNQAIVELGYDLLIFTNGTIRQNFSSVKEKQYINFLNSNVADGVLIAMPVSPDYYKLSSVVAIDPNIMDHEGKSDGVTVIAENEMGARRATQYLIELGHRKIAFVTGSMDLLSSTLRKRGYEDTLKKNGIEVDPDFIEYADFTEKSGYESGKRLLSAEKKPTAVFCSNDKMAIGLMHAAEELGVEIPKDLSVIGFDNIIEAKSYDLTTIDQFASEMAYQATYILHKIINGEELDNKVEMIRTELVVRGTTARLNQEN
jgi:LacI family transcriptional regulator